MSLLHPTLSKEYLVRKMFCRYGGLWGTIFEDGTVALRSPHTGPRPRCKIWYTDPEAPRRVKFIPLLEDKRKSLIESGVSVETVDKILGPSEFNYPNNLYKLNTVISPFDDDY